MKKIKKKILNSTNTVLADSSFCLDYKDHLMQTLEQVIKYEFPKIENLNIVRGEGTNLTITFNEGQYTKEEVEKKLEEIRNYKFDINSLKDMTIEETPFGIRMLPKAK